MWMTRYSKMTGFRTILGATLSASLDPNAEIVFGQSRLFHQLGYRDYLGALQCFRVEHPYEPHLVTAASYLVDYPFSERLYPGALDVLKMFRTWGRAVILSDGDVVFQPRKIERSGIFEIVDGHVLIYIHKEEALEDVQRRYPAEHYVLVDDKLRILTAVKQAWGDRVTTVFPRQGNFAHDPAILATYPAADVTVERIGDLLAFDLHTLLNRPRPSERPKYDSQNSRGNLMTQFGVTQEP